MSDYFANVKNYLSDLDLKITHEDADEELVVVEDEARGIKGLVIDCEDPILIMEQAILDLSSPGADILTRLLQMNRGLVHGAFALDEAGSKVIFRDTLQLANLDFNEIEATVNALSLGLAEYGNELIKFAQK